MSERPREPLVLVRAIRAPWRWRQILPGCAAAAVGIFGLAGPLPSDLAAQPSRQEIVEGQARELVRLHYSYHRYTFNREARPIPSDAPDAASGWPESCIGVTLEECFGGDPDCHAYGIGAQSASPTSATLIRQCTAPGLPAVRAEVLWRLDSLGALAPENDWIVGQRVNFALKNGDAARAYAIARSCEATPWWCQALRGYALHRLDPGSGGAAFDSAYANAPAGTPAWGEPRIPEAGDRGLHCEWVDLSYLLEDERLLSRYERAPCGEARMFAERFWWLADPLWSQPGNPRRDEHVARNVLARLRDQILRAWWVGANNHHAHVRRASTPEGVTIRGWDGDLWGHGTLVRVGVPNSWRGISWSQVRTWGTVRYGPTGVAMYFTPGNPTLRPSGLRGQMREGFVNGGYSFVPDAGRYLDPVASTAEDWAVTWNDGHERMITRETWHDLPHHQTAVLRREEGLLVLAAARLPVLVSSFDSVRAALAMGRPADLRIDIAPASVDPSGVVRAEMALEDGDRVASVEIRGEGWVGRARHGAPAPALDEHGFGISAPLLVDERFEGGGQPLRSTLLPTTHLEGRTRVGVYFEVYGLEAEEPVQIRLTAMPLGAPPSLLGRIARALGVGSGTPSPGIEIEWSEGADMARPGRAERDLVLDLGGLGAGEYELSVRVERANGAVAVGSRKMRLAG